jgi:hypothetical protein
VKEYFEKLWGLPVSGKWKSYRIRTIRDQEDSVIVNMPSDDEEKGDE